MRIKRTELVNALDAVKGGVAQKSFSPILTHVLIDGKTVMSFDSEIGIKATLSDSIGGTFNARHDLLTSLLKGLDAEDVEIEVGGEKIKVSAGRHRSTLAMITEEFPRPEVPKSKWTDVPAGFKECLERVMLSVHESEQEKLLSCMLIRGDQIIAHDRKSMALCTLPGLGAPQSLLSKKAVQEIIRLGQPNRYAIVGAWSLWDYGNLTLLARLREGGEAYPALWEKLGQLGLEKREKSSVPDGLLAALTRLTLFADADHKRIDLKPGENEGGKWLELVSRSPLGDATEVLDGTTGPNGKAFNAGIIAKALPYANALHWGENTADPLLLTGEVGAFTYILSPIRG